MSEESNRGARGAHVPGADATHDVQESSHGHSQKHHHSHKGGHAEGHGGGEHGAAWLVTYCDMITLLIACFICIITFASGEKEYYSPKRDSILYGTGGTGLVGPEKKGLDNNSVLWRERPLLSRLGAPGSEMAPQYSGYGVEATTEMLRKLEGEPPGTLLDSYATQIPMRLLFGPDGHLVPSGIDFLHSIAQNIRHLPYDVYIQVNSPENIPRAVEISSYFAQGEAIHPGRVGIGLRPESSQTIASLWFLFVRQP